MIVKMLTNKSLHMRGQSVLCVEGQVIRGDGPGVDRLCEAVVVAGWAEEIDEAEAAALEAKAVEAAKTVEEAKAEDLKAEEPESVTAGAAEVAEPHEMESNESDGPTETTESPTEA